MQGEMQNCCYFFGAISISGKAEDLRFSTRKKLWRCHTPRQLKGRTMEACIGHNEVVLRRQAHARQDPSFAGGRC
jgi:hypothetical protein